jgi:DNA polymerase-1
MVARKERMNKLQCKQIIRGLPPVSSQEDVWGLDLELSGLKETQLHRPYGRLTSLAGTMDGETVFIIFEQDEVAEFLNRIKESTYVFHNSTFDIGHLRRWADVPERKNMRDTLLIERLMWSNYYDDFTLAALVRRYLKCYMEKDIRKEFHELEGAMTQEQIEYAALDVIGTWLVDKEQQKIIEKTDQVIWNNLYNPHVWTTLELGGFKLDVDCWRDLAEKNQKIVDEITEELGVKYGVKKSKLVGRGKSRHEEEYFEPFNPSSPAQVLKILNDQGISVDSTGDKIIRPWYDENEFVKKTLDYREAEKQASTYGLSFLKNVEDDSRIYTSLNISKAETGRDSSSSPNLQNIPSSPIRRKCFVAGEGRKLVLFDYSGQEANLFAYITNDPTLKEIINSGKKLYIEVARLAFDEIVTKGSERYAIIKALVLGLMYGLTPYGFARDNEVDVEVAEDMFNRFFQAFPVAAQWVKEKQSRNAGVTKTIIDRTCHLHPYDHQWKNNSLNNPMQGSGADMIKIAMKKFRKSEFYQKYHPENIVNLILQVHDEIVVECVTEYAEECANVLKSVMIETAEMMHPGIRGNVSGGIIDSWDMKE